MSSNSNPLPAKLWVLVKSNNPAVINNPTQVLTKDCENVDDFIEAIKKELSPILDNVAVSQLTLSLPDGITRAYSGLAKECFASDQIEDTKLDPGCLLSALVNQNVTSKTPFIVKANASKSLSIIVDLNNG